jgi:putative ABC transport system permease protein
VLSVVRLIALRSMRLAPLRTALTVSGIALGVAVVFAIHVLNRSVMASFARSIADVSGRSALCVGRGSGVAEELLDTVRAVPGVAAAAPIIEDTVRDAERGTVLALLGVDATADRSVRDYERYARDVQVEDELAFLNDPHGLLLPRALADRIGVRPGGSLSLATSQGRQTYHVRGLLSPTGPAQVFGGDVVVMDVYAAQIALGRGRRFDRIDVVLEEGHDTTAVAQALASALGGAAAISRPEERSEETERLLGTFRLALSLTSLVAVCVGGFIVYNALAIAVAQRRRDIGVLRALGMTRREVRRLFVSEGLALGVLGSVVGILLGLGLARAALSLVGETVSALYVKVAPESLALTTEDVLLAAALGVLASLLAAWFPARRAAAVEPVLAMQRKPDAADVSFGSTAKAARASAITLGAAGLCAVWAHHTEAPMLGHVVSAGLAFGVAFASPLVASGVGALGERVLGKLGPSALLGALSFRRDAGRSAVAIAALGMALANTVAIDGLLGSMKVSTHAWLDRAFRAELFVLGGSDVRAKFDHPMPGSLVESLRADPDVEFVQPFRMAQHSFRGAPFYLMSEDLRGYERYNQLGVADGDFEACAAALKRGESVGVSQAFARLFGVKRGDALTLQTARGPRTFRVDLVYVDYRTDAGAVLIERSVYLALFEDTLVDLVGVYLKEGRDPAAARARIAAGPARALGLLVLENRAYMDQLVGLIDRSLSLCHAGEAVAIVVALLGMLNTLAVSVLDRRTEHGTLRALGASRAQLKRVVLTESLLMACAASLVGLAMGLALSAYGVREALRFELGWQLELSVSVGVLVAVPVLAQLAGLASALVPMRSAAAVDAATALAAE